MPRFRWFRIIATSITLIFMGLMALVSIIAFSRQSGSTGLDMAQIHKMRLDVTYKNRDSSTIDTAENKP